MQTKKSFGIIGGDMRQYYLAESLLKDGFEVMIFGFEKVTEKSDNFKKLPLSEVINLSDYIILPVPITRDQKIINAPFSDGTIDIDNKLLNSFENKKIFGGIIIPPIENHVKNNKFLFYDYYEENFVMENAFLTAEGAIKVFLGNSLKSINKSRCLVLGYGRIGKCLCKILKNFGASVTATARNAKDKRLIEQNGYDFYDTNKLINNQNLPCYDVVFNTVPAVILDKNILKKLSSDVMIIDLASLPGGIDKHAAKALNIRLFHELGIPGKYFPKSAGEIIKKTIYKIIKEENI